MREQIDLLVLAPLDVEIEALISNIESAGGLKKRIGLISGCHSYDLGERSIVVIQLDGQGCLQSSIQTMNMLDEFDPEFTVSFGIAGSLDREKVKLGNVVIGETIYYYEPAKETVNKAIPISHDKLDSKLPSQFNSISLSQHLIFSCYVPKNKPALEGITVHYRKNIASGEKVLADESSNSRLLLSLIHRKMACAEMEAAGVAAAAKYHNQSYGRNKFIAIKGISDYADKNKNNMTLGGANGEDQETDKEKMETKKDPDEQARQTIAANNAAKFLVELIQHMAHDEITIQKNRSRVKNAKEVEGTFEKWLEKFHGICECEINADLLKRAAFYVYHQPGRLFERKVPIYYHWQQFDENGLHLVDYLQLILMHKLSKSNCIAPVALITNKLFSPDQLGKISAQVEKIIGSAPCFSSEIYKVNDDYSTYCLNNGYEGNEVEKIATLFHVRADSGRYALLNLLPYVAYKSRHIGRCIVLCYKPHRQIYDELLMKILSLQPIYLDVGEINVDGKAAKLNPESCAKELIINPASSYAEFSAWAKQNPDNNNEVLKYIKCLMSEDECDEIDKELIKLTQLIENA